MQYDNLLKDLTVDCKDNGEVFFIKDRIKTIKNLLMDVGYGVREEGDLSLVYAKENSTPNQFKVLISSHVDCVYSDCFVSDLDEEHWLGTLDNSASNAVLVDLMLEGKFEDSVVIAFTGDEERGASGAVEVMRYLARLGCGLERIIVTDVTNEGWNDQAMFTVENDKGVDIVTGYRIISELQECGYPCNFLHDAEPDETWEYSKGIQGLLNPIPCLSLCLPVQGDMHGEEGVVLRRSSILPYEDVLLRLAHL